MRSRPLDGMRLDATALRDAPASAHPLLAPGDVPYLPRGVPHAADALGEGALHLSLGVLTIT